MAILLVMTLKLEVAQKENLREKIKNDNLLHVILSNQY